MSRACWTEEESLRSYWKDLLVELQTQWGPVSRAKKQSKPYRPSEIQKEKKKTQNLGEQFIRFQVLEEEHLLKYLKAKYFYICP